MKNPSRQESLWTRIVRGRCYYAMLAPFAVMFTAFVLAPIAASVVMSFTDFNLVQTPDFVGLQNYIRMFFDDSVFLIAFKNTMLFALFTGPVSYVVCLFFAWLVNELRPGLRTVFTFLLYIPAMSSAVYTVWAFIFSGDQYGLVNSVLMNLGLAKEPIQWLSDPDLVIWVVIGVQLWMSLSTAFLSFLAGFQGIDRQQYEAAAIDGVSNRLQEFWLITIPNMGPQLLFGAVMQIGASFAAGEVGTALLTAAGSGTVATDYAATTLVTHMLEMGTTRNEMGYAFAIAVFLFLMMTLFNSVIRRVLKHFTA
ncbi:carbohydrate ABC transporter permease [Candidatus Allofournierella merdipullorum]|uniref:carbohydrate ABC transporter permease n=1 Tax=Candidatus Allofournierella merdipullorum TaxID=2838595 RepID=UPI003AB46DF2